MEVYEFEPTMLHTKMLIFDGFMVSVGSTKLDTRSFELNDEASLNVYDSRLSGPTDSPVRSDLARATRYRLENWRSRPLTQKLAEEILLPLRAEL